MFTKILKQTPPAEANPLQALPQLCPGCLWRGHDGVTCEAFPEGIPNAILLGVFDHHAHYEDEHHNDQGITFTPKGLFDKL